MPKPQTAEQKVRARERAARWRVQNPVRARAKVKEWVERLTPDARRKYRRGAQLKYRYGITVEQFDALLTAQANCCAVCKSAFDKTPHIDHRHSDGKVRGLLCEQCNRGIGCFRDSPEALNSAAEYLRG